MVNRMSEDFNLNPAQGSGITVPSQGAQQDVTGKYRTVNPVEGAASSVLQSLYGSVAKLGESAWRHSTEEAYVKGAAQAGVVAAETDLQNDGLTRDWEVAGYRDTAGKLQQAKQEAAFLAALPDLRAKGIDEPGGLNEYLATQRSEYESTYNGMSREAREGSVAKRITFEQQAIAQYTKARKEYIYGVRSAALRSAFNPAVAKLESALLGGDAKEIVAARENVATIFTADVWNQSGVSDDDKNALTKELLDRLFVTDDTGTYGMLDQVGLLNKLSAEDQTKYAEKYRESLNRNNARRFAEYDDELAQRFTKVLPRDYAKIMRRLPELLAPAGQVLACCNDPAITPAFLIAEMAREAPQLQFIERLANPPEFIDTDPDAGLKVLRFVAQDATGDSQDGRWRSRW